MINDNGDRLLSRSAMEAQQVCPRLRYWQYEHEGRGVVPRYANIPMNTGSAVHKGMEFCFKVWLSKGGNAVLQNIHKVADIAVVKAIDWYTAFVQESGGLIGDNMSPQYAAVNEQERIKQEVIYQEQLGLIAGLVTVWCYAELPMLVKYFDIVSTEKEVTAYLGDEKYKQLNQSRADGLLRDKKTNDVYIYQLKTTKEFNWKLELSYSTDMQSITDLYTIRKAIPDVSIMGIKFCYLVKGKKYKDEQLGIWRTNSSLLKGYRQFQPGGLAYAHTNKIPKPENKSGYGYLGKGWEEFEVMKEYPYEMGDSTHDRVINWVRDIHAGKIQADMFPPMDWLKSMCVTPLEVRRDRAEIESVINQLMHQECKVQQSLKFVDTMTSENDYERSLLGALDLQFPQYFRSCWYPSDCMALPLCHGKRQWDRQPVLVQIDDMRDLREGSTAAELYSWRMPHHESEAAMVADKD